MLELYTIDGNTITINRGEILAYKEFNAILTRHEGSSHGNLATLEMMYIKFMSDKFRKTNMYAVVPDDERSDMIIRDIGLPKGWKPDAAVNRAIAKYQQIQDDMSPTSALLQNLLIGINQTNRYVRVLNEKMQNLLDEVATNRDKEGREVDGGKSLAQIETIKNVLFKTAQELPKLLDNLSLLEDKVLTEYGVAFKRGGKVKNNREDPERMIK